MRVGIIICLVVLVLLAVEVYKQRIVAKGYLFCEISKEFFIVLKEIEETQKDPENSGKSYILKTDHIKLKYFTNNKELFLQYEIIIAYLLDLYESIEKKEKFFRVEDWKRVKEVHEELLKKIYHINYLKWLKGYRKIT